MNIKEIFVYLALLFASWAIGILAIISLNEFLEFIVELFGGMSPFEIFGLFFLFGIIPTLFGLAFLAVTLSVLGKLLSKEIAMNE